MRETESSLPSDGVDPFPAARGVAREAVLRRVRGTRDGGTVRNHTVCSPTAQAKAKTAKTRAASRAWYTRSVYPCGMRQRVVGWLPPHENGYFVAMAFCRGRHD